MIKKTSPKKRGYSLATILVGVVVAFLVLVSVQEKHGIDFGLPKLTLPGSEFITGLFRDNLPFSNDAVAVINPDAGDARLRVHFIDVGQAKSIFIQGPLKNVLIDAGENNQGQAVLRYLSAQNIKSLDVVVATHPHSDHIGGLEAVIRGLPVETVILPVIPGELTPTTNTYTDLLESIAVANLKITPAKPGAEYDLGDGAVLTILGPHKEYGDLNDLSVVSRLDYGETSFLFTGDATTYAESDMLAAGDNLRANVLDVGHHGSATSNSGEFLYAVNPHVSVISCGIDNSYGHPSREVVQRLKEYSNKIVRTDLDGTIVIASDGKSLGIETEKGDKQ